MTPTRIKERLRYILHLDETPHQLALSFAVGVFVAFMPAIGFHTATVLLLAWVLRLNKAVALTGTFINNPWTIALVFIGPTWVAAVVMRKMGIDVPPFHYDALAERFSAVMVLHRFWELAFWKGLAREFRPYLHAFFIGTTLAGVLAAFISYGLSYVGIKYYRIEMAKLHELKERRRSRN